MKEIIIRDVTVDDFSDIFLLLHQLWPGKELHKDSLLKVFLPALKSSNDHYLCAEIDSRIIGFCSLVTKGSLWQEGLIAYVNELVVAHEFKGKGIGTGLMKAVINIAKEKGCKRIELDSAFTREGSHDFYNRMGFKNRAYLFSKEL